MQRKTAAAKGQQIQCFKVPCAARMLVVYAHAHIHANIYIHT